MQHCLQHSAGRLIDDHSAVIRKPLLKFPQLARSQKSGSYCYRHAVRLAQTAVSSKLCPQTAVVPGTEQHPMHMQIQSEA